MIFIDHFIQKQQNTHSFQVHIEFFSERSHAGPQASLDKFKKVKIISSSFSNQNAIRNKLQEKTVKSRNTWRLKNILLNNQWITEEIKEQIFKDQDTNDKENMMIQPPWDAARIVLRKNFIPI